MKIKMLTFKNLISVSVHMHTSKINEEGGGIFRALTTVARIRTIYWPNNLNNLKEGRKLNE